MMDGSANQEQVHTFRKKVKGTDLKNIFSLYPWSHSHIRLEKQPTEMLQSSATPTPAP